MLLQPANIFLTTDGTIKVGDLGLSREMSDETMQAFSKVGTPLYMSPEVLKGDGYDFKSDIWSMGCLLYEVCREISAEAPSFFTKPVRIVSLSTHCLACDAQVAFQERRPQFVPIVPEDLQGGVSASV